MNEHEPDAARVKKLLAQDAEINDTQLKELHMNLESALESREATARRARRGVVIAVAIYGAAMVLAMLFGSAHNTVRSGWLGFTYESIIIVALAAGWMALVVGAWLMLSYFYRFAPALKRARFDVQTAMIRELQEQVSQLRNELDQLKK